ncbi:MAG: OmpH family outer membrane protein [Bacteroidetes bacterium]|nr:OmpH family outer membrane protein [Bacteroidota bacterium]
MKNIVKILALCSLAILLTTASKAQGVLKIGYIDFNTLVAAMPGVDSVKTKLQKYQQTLSDQLDAMRAEFENKYLEYQQGSSGMSDLIKQTKEKELQDLQGRIDAFQQKAQSDLQAKQQELLQPIVLKAKTAIKEVAKENKYTYILNAIEDVVLFSEPADDIMPLVKKKLEIQ